MAKELLVYSVAGGTMRTRIIEGTTAAMVTGSIAVTGLTDAVTTSRVQLTHMTFGGTVGVLSFVINPGVGFTITSESATDTSTVHWVFYP